MTSTLPNELIKMIIHEALQPLRIRYPHTVLSFTRDLALTSKTFAAFVREELGPLACNAVNTERAYLEVLKPKAKFGLRAHEYRDLVGHAHIWTKQLHMFKKDLDRLIGRNHPDELRDLYSKRYGWRRVEKLSKRRVKAAAADGDASFERTAEH